MTPRARSVRRLQNLRAVGVRTASAEGVRAQTLRSPIEEGSPQERQNKSFLLLRSEQLQELYRLELLIGLNREVVLWYACEIKLSRSSVSKYEELSEVEAHALIEMIHGLVREFASSSNDFTDKEEERRHKEESDDDGSISAKLLSAILQASG